MFRAYLKCNLFPVSTFCGQILRIQAEPDELKCYPLLICTDQLKQSISVEIDRRKVQYGRVCNKYYRQKMNEILSVIDRFEKVLSRPIKDLEDIRVAMNALKVSSDSSWTSPSSCSVFPTISDHRCLELKLHRVYEVKLSNVHAMSDLEFIVSFTLD